MGEEASEEEGDAGGWAHVEVSAAGHVPFVQRLVEGGGAPKESLRRERESREAWVSEGGRKVRGVQVRGAKVRGVKPRGLKISRVRVQGTGAVRGCEYASQ